MQDSNPEERVTVLRVAEPAAGQVKRVRPAELVPLQLVQPEEQVLVRRAQLEELVQAQPVAGLVQEQLAQPEEQVLVRRAAERVRVHRASNRPATVDRILRVWHTVFVELSPLLVLLEVEPAAGQVQRVRPAEQVLVQLAQLEERVQAQRVLKLVLEQELAQRVLEPAALANRQALLLNLPQQNRRLSGKSRSRNNILLAGKANPLLIRERVFY